MKPPIPRYCSKKVPLTWVLYLFLNGRVKFPRPVRFQRYWIPMLWKSLMDGSTFLNSLLLSGTMRVLSPLWLLFGPKKLTLTTAHSSWSFTIIMEKLFHPWASSNMLAFLAIASMHVALFWAWVYAALTFTSAMAVRYIKLPPRARRVAGCCKMVKARLSVAFVAIKLTLHLSVWRRK